MDNIKLYELLGAKTFQKVVFKAEDLKYIIINKFFPNIDIWYNKKIDKSVRKKCKKLKSETVKQEIIQEGLNQKLLFKKELNTRHNRNYHFDINHPEVFLSYLNWNKIIHKKGLRNDLIVMSLVVPVLFFSTGPILITSSFLFLVSTLSTFIDFQCINLQNYNIARIEEKLEKLKRVQAHINKKNIKKFNDINEVISNELYKSKDIPSLDSIIEQSRDKGKLDELRELLKEEAKKRNMAITTDKVKISVKTTANNSH